MTPPHAAKTYQSSEIVIDNSKFFAVFQEHSFLLALDIIRTEVLKLHLWYDDAQQLLADTDNDIVCDYELMTSWHS